MVYSKLLNSRRDSIVITDPSTLSINYYIQAYNIQKYSERHTDDKVLKQRFESVVSCGEALSNLGETVSNVQTDRLASIIAQYHGLTDDANETDVELTKLCAVKKDVDNELNRLRKYFLKHNKSVSVAKNNNNTYQHESIERGQITDSSNAADDV